MRGLPVINFVPKDTFNFSKMVTTLPFWKNLEPSSASDVRLSNCACVTWFWLRSIFLRSFSVTLCLVWQLTIMKIYQDFKNCPLF